jgi:pimeloyl-ACP methyl ester carboxylesterase
MRDQNNNIQEHPPIRRGRKRLLWLGGILAGVLVLLLASTIYESVAEAAEARAYPPPGQMVDVGGYRLHINCTGAGSPTVVIDAGLGDWSSMWGFVQPGVAKTTRVCTYDRAGIGWSDPGPLPRDARQFTKELHTLLQNAHIPGPYVLVGHSMGGLPVRVFAHEYASEVAGVVLIDSMSPGPAVQSQAGSIPQTGAKTYAFSPFPALARLGIVRLLVNLLNLAPYELPDKNAYLSLYVRPQNVQAFVEETQGMEDSLAQAGAVKTFGDLPLIVLSRGLDLNPVDQAGQLRLAQLSSNSQHLIAEKSDHLIQLHQSDAAVAAIIKMVEQVRR